MALHANMRREAAAVQLLLTLWIWGHIRTSEGIWINLPSTGTKCVSEELHSNVVVLGEYAVVSDDHSTLPTISIKVTSPYGHNLHQLENVTHGQFAFTSQETGNYLACFWVTNHPSPAGVVSINIDWKSGIAAKDWESVAKKEKLEGVELELRKLEGAVEAIHESLIYCRARESELRSVSEETNTRVAWYSTISLAICIVVSVLQLWYLKHFFQKKKLI